MSISRPRLRPIETIVVPDPRYGQAIVLRDTEGVTSKTATIPAPLVPIVARFTGAHTLEEIAALVTQQTGSPVSTTLVRQLAQDLDHALFLDTPRFDAAKQKVEQEFLRASLRPASHAGGAYHADPAKLAAYLDGDCIGSAGRKKANGAIRGLIAPHIDPWRGKLGYGHAYGLLRAALSEEVDTFVLLGTSHAPMREPFALCRKGFATPLGNLDCADDLVDTIAANTRFDAFSDVFNHKREHSLEFQAVFVRHLVGARDVRIVPVLCGLGESQRTGRSPEGDRKVESFLEAIRSIVERLGQRTVVIAGADLAHVGPRFGDPSAYDEEARGELQSADRTSLDLAEQLAHRDFFAHVQADLDTRRVCGLGPIYSLLRVLPSEAKGQLAHYEQTIDPDEGSIVSHAAMAFYAG